MTNNFLSKGSVWQKWDLQIHIPETKLANQYKTEDSTDVWDKFTDCLKNSDVSVFGITDYFSIDGYVKLLEKIKSNKDFKDRAFFPNIEFRLDISTNTNSEEINIHILFDNKCKIEDVKTFLSKLETTNTKSNGSHYHCTSEDLTSLGYDKACISLSNLKKALKETFGNDKPYLIAGASNGTGGIRANTKSPRKMGLSDEVDKECDFFFGREQDREYFLKENRYENKTIKSVAKPVVATSDCHSFDDIENFLGKQYKKGNALVKDITWIKADKTFEGLRQILFEPFDRVAFGYEKPEAKKSYFLIDKVRFIDNTGQDNFLSDAIEVNHNLATIIGGKSTGKSLLLYYIAKTVDLQEIKNRFVDHPSATQYNFDESPDFNFEVVWADGESTYLKSIEGSDNGSERKILYIPQNYLNKLSEKNVKSRETLNKFVKDVLLQDETVKDKYESNLSQIKTLSKSIPVSVTNLYQIKQEIVEIEENIKQLGEEKGIQKYLMQIQKEADEIKNKSGLSEQEIKDYEKFLDQEKKVTTGISILFEDKKSIALFKQNILHQLESLEELRDEQPDYMGDETIISEFIKEFGILGQIKTNILASVDKITVSIDAKLEANKKELEKIKKDLAPFMAKVKLQDELRKKNDAIKEEQKKLNKISLEKKGLASKRGNYEKEKKFLIETYRNIFIVYDATRNEFKKYENNFEDISLNVSVGFNEQRFNDEVIHGSLNKPDIKRCIDGVDWKDEYEYQYDPNNHIAFILAVFNAVVDGKIKTIKNKSPKDTIVKILEDYFDLDFKISYKNDSLDKMSPGKKGLVLLRLLIDLSSEEWPILLDQPEDDLDNRSVYDDLVSFVKKKKKQRQIIIVTHNPNLAVGADAEEVIVANQDGQEKGRENKKYKFEYVSGALENTFELSETEQKAILFRKGIRQHVYEVLEGGKEAFQKRERKYSFHS
ncbi:MAG: hypothetical protein PHX78_07230 [bacterium]|nr:hypothetical protein [bacterium]